MPYFDAFLEELRALPFDERLDTMASVVQTISLELTNELGKPELNEDVASFLDDAQSNCSSVYDPLYEAQRAVKNISDGKEWTQLCERAHDAGYDYAGDFCSWHEKDLDNEPDFLDEARCELEGCCGDIAAGVIGDTRWPFGHEDEIVRVECLADHVYDGIIECMREKGYEI